jgi:AbrB family looped-hinge helix DNA binding protein
MECLVFAYLARTEKWKSLEWYCQAGSDLGRDIWGVCLRFVMEAPMESAITVKGQATIPKAIREHLGLKPGDRVKFFVHPDGSVVLLPKLPASALRGIIKSRRRRPVTIEAMTQAAAEGAATGTAASQTTTSG